MKNQNHFSKNWKTFDVILKLIAFDVELDIKFDI